MQYQAVRDTTLARRRQRRSQKQASYQQAAHQVALGLETLAVAVRQIQQYEEKAKRSGNGEFQERTASFLLRMAAPQQRQDGNCSRATPRDQGLQPVLEAAPQLGMSFLPQKCTQQVSAVLQNSCHLDMKMCSRRRQFQLLPRLQRLLLHLLFRPPQQCSSSQMLLLLDSQSAAARAWVSQLAARAASRVEALLAPPAQRAHVNLLLT